MPFFDYQPENCEGNFLVFSLLALPFFLLFGTSYVSLKLVALSFSLAILILLYLFLNRFFNKKVAILASLIFIFSPPGYTSLSLIAAAGHFCSNLFTILILFVFCRIFTQDSKPEFPHQPEHIYGLSPRKQYPYFILLGLVSGFGTWFIYTNLIVIFTCLLFWFVFDKRFFLRKYFFIFLGSFLLGFSPGIYYNLTHNFEGLNIYNQPIYHHFLANTFSQSLTKFKDLVLFDLPRSFLFEDLGIIKGEYISYFYYLIFVISFVVILWSNKSSILKFISGIIPSRRFRVSPKGISRETLFLAYPFIFCLIYSFSDFEPKIWDGGCEAFEAYRYLAPLFIFICIIISLFLNKIWERRRQYIRIIPVLILTALVSIGLIGNIGLISFSDFGKSLKIRGYSYEGLGWVIGWRFGENPDRCIQLVEKKVDEEYRAECYKGIGWGVTNIWSLEGAVPIKYIDLYIRLIEKIDERYKPDCYRRMAEVVYFEFEGDNMDEFSNLCIRTMKEIDSKYGPLFHKFLVDLIVNELEEDDIITGRYTDLFAMLNNLIKNR
jgi:hypothetical protein